MTILHRILLTLIATLLLGTAAIAAEPPLTEGQTPQPALEAGSYAYQLFLPTGYLASGRERWPVLIFLHGSGERGDGLDKVKVHGPPKLLAGRPGFPFITVSPQLPADGTSHWDVRTLDRMLDLLVKRLRIDPARIYVSGLSLGGHATWDWAAARPDRFAAIAPVAGRGDVAVACALKDVPIWAFHGDSDPIVPVEGSFMMVQAVRRCGGHPRLTLYPATGHDSWTETYDNSALYVWLLEHRRIIRPLPPRDVS